MNQTVPLKRCPRCKQDKPLLTDFYNRRGKIGGSVHCKLCNTEHQVERQRKHKLAVIDALGNQCARCEQSYPPAVYELHHPDPAKKDPHFASLLSRSLANILRAIREQGCILLCANCHRITHSSVR